MIIINTFPPNYEKIKEHFPSVENNRSVIFTYGHAIYNPYNGHIDVPLQFHEATHSLQQDKLGAEKWWEKYLADPEFRLSQELEAYKNQFNKYKKTEKDRNKITRFLHTIASDLSGEIYGNLIPLSKARKLIEYGNN